MWWPREVLASLGFYSTNSAKSEERESPNESPRPAPHCESDWPLLNPEVIDWSLAHQNHKNGNWRQLYIYLLWGEGGC